ncbi:unnamed protein product [[Actinomadura] parvosata subsp. kistnae]|nr:unnamed protein product [Actinomadura parvosata subsp. kistnae]
MQLQVVRLGRNAPTEGEDQPIIQQPIQRLDISSELRGLQPALGVPQVLHHEAHPPSRRRTRARTFTLG